MSIVSALFRVVGRHGEARMDDMWHSLGRVRDDRQTHRHGDSRFLYPPSCMHVHFDAPQSRGQDDAAAGKNMRIGRNTPRYR